MGKHSYSALEKRNSEKYLKAPSYEETIEFIKSLGVSNFRFERFYGLAPTTINKMKCEGRQLPIRAWHFVYEKIVPAYGVGFFHEHIELEESKKETFLPKKSESKKSEPKKQIEISNHGRLQSLKNK